MNRGSLKVTELFAKRYLTKKGLYKLCKRQIEDRLMDGEPGPLIRSVAKLMDDITGRNDMRFKDWLFQVHKIE